jgi:transglutaminase-like putative cysteine protease
MLFEQGCLVRGRRRYGSPEPKMSLRVFDVQDQKEALRQLAELAQQSSVHPRVREAAIAIAQTCEARDDGCELEAIFQAVKHGTPAVPGLQNGIRYVADPRWADHFTAPYRLLEQAARGIASGDCDDHASLIAALAAAVGFQVGLRVWGPDSSEYVHVYAVAGLSKRDPKEAVGMDSTVDESYVGWEPPGGAILTAWLE